MSNYCQHGAGREYERDCFSWSTVQVVEHIYNPSTFYNASRLPSSNWMYSKADSWRSRVVLVLFWIGLETHALLLLYSCCTPLTKLIQLECIWQSTTCCTQYFGTKPGLLEQPNPTLSRFIVDSKASVCRIFSKFHLTLTMCRSWYCWKPTTTSM